MGCDFIFKCSFKFSGLISGPSCLEQWFGRERDLDTHRGSSLERGNNLPMQEVDVDTIKSRVKSSDCKVILGICVWYAYCY